MSRPVPEPPGRSEAKALRDVPAGSIQIRLLIAFSIVLPVLVLLLVEPIPQDPAYHGFVDIRTIAGIPNFWNVASNLPFLFVGLYGLLNLTKAPGPTAVKSVRLAWYVLFTGITLTAFGSSYYHLAPGNDSLFWDRFPMTIAFAGLFTVVIGEYLTTRRLGLLLALFVAIGSASVVYWRYTEASGTGDLRPYAIVQFLPILLIPPILLLRGNASSLTRYFWAMIALYLSAKVFEFFDTAIFSAGGLISGHSIKHLAAALAPAALLPALTARNARPPP